MVELSLYIGLFVYLFLFIAILLTLISLFRISKALTVIAEKISNDDIN